MLTEIKAALTGLGALALLLAGFLLGKYAYAPKVEAKSTAHAQRQQADGSLVAARTSAAANTGPAQQLPAGAAPTATARLHIAARLPVPIAATVSTPALKSCAQQLTCPALDIDETLVKDPDGQSDLLVSGPGLSQARFTPLADVQAAEPWAAGLSMDSSRQYGLFLDRDLGRIRLGLELNERKGGTPGQREAWEGRIRLGWRF